MENRASVRQTAGMVESETRLRVPLDVYMEQQSESMQTFHRWMGRLEVASLGIGIAAFIAAVVITINHVNTVPGNAIWAVWFIVPACFISPFGFLLGLHTAILRACPPIRLNVERKAFLTDRPAVGLGWAMMVGSLVTAAYWGMGAYAFINPDILDILIPSIVLPLVGLGILGILGGVGRWLWSRSR
ncbi:MAG TPA: hypothetical protein VJ436_09545 [Anaerolineales bacterium]|nr:hypothetical protein [Anaerolineales bacterium]